MLKMDRWKEGNTVGINKQASVRKSQTRGWSCEDGQGVCVVVVDRSAGFQ